MRRREGGSVKCEEEGGRKCEEGGRECEMWGGGEERG